MGSLVKTLLQKSGLGHGHGMERRDIQQAGLTRLGGELCISGKVGESVKDNSGRGDRLGDCDINQNGQGRNNLGLGHVGGI